jgi:hypothetical protein
MFCSTAEVPMYINCVGRYAQGRIYMRRKQHNPLSLCIIFAATARSRGEFALTYAAGGSSMHFGSEEEIESTNWFSSNDPLDQATANSPPGNDSAVHVLLPNVVPRPAYSNEAPHNSMEHPENIRKTH